MSVREQGSVRKMDMIMLQGKMIRYVHIPDEVDAIENLTEHVSPPDFYQEKLQSLLCV